MTSNLGSEHIAKMGSLGFLSDSSGEKQSLKEKVMESLREHFKPEFLNRVDEIIIFDYLKKEEIRKIVDLELDKVAGRLKTKGIKIQLSSAAKEFLAERGYDPNLGARPLKRVIQKMVLDPLAVQIVTGKISQGEEVSLDVSKGKIVFNSKSVLKKRKMA
jgi:ATP-dependent Clp protease ATP-binding subunit ClpA